MMNNMKTEAGGKIVEFFTNHTVARTSLATGATVFTYLFGVVGQAHYALIILITLDTLTGAWKAARAGKLRSARLFKGTFSKVVMYTIFLISVHQLINISGQFYWFDEWGILFLGITELLSIIENLHALGFLIPSWVSERLHSILEKPHL